MNVGVVGSRSLKVDCLEKYLPENTKVVVSGGAIGIDTCAKNWAINNKITLREFLPEYTKYGITAPLRRNVTIVKNSDLVIAFWDRKSRGTVFTLKKCAELGVPYKIFVPSKDDANTFEPYFKNNF